MSEDGNEPIDPLAAIRHLLPDLPVEAGWLGENYKGWQRFANALKIVSEEYDFPMTVKAKNGYLQVDYPFAPPHLLAIGYAIEMATDQICQYCGRHPAREEVRSGWVWKLCDRCIRTGAGLPK
ncbi:hypothetical protein ACQCLI_12710 [Pseudomonas nitroreducens]|uniref:hypothetical protein n=1 Tax=Pseudomonas nitroreducens TaxID=46680 RepID=UPI003D0930C3